MRLKRRKTLRLCYPTRQPLRSDSFNGPYPQRLWRRGCGAVYPYRFFVEAGGLMSYGPNLIDGYRRTASYVDRTLRGEKPGDLDRSEQWPRLY